MLYAHTIFDNQHDSRPLITGLYDSDLDNFHFYPMWIKGTGLTIYQIEENIENLKNIINSESSFINDSKQHIIAFDLDHNADLNEYYIPSPKSNLNLDSSKNYIDKVVDAIKRIKMCEWNGILGKAAFPYAYMQKRGYTYNYSNVDVIWSRIWSGRSCCTGFNVQGCTDGLRYPGSFPYFINFDWISADIRAIAIMSGDDVLEDSFINSDPYTVLMDYINNRSNDTYARDDVKMMMFKAIYSLSDVDGYVSDCFCKFGRWIEKCKVNIRRDRYLDSILGRRFHLSKDRSDKSVFNATIQGTVAHAMQSCIRRVYDLYPDNLLMENHDSLVMTSSKDGIKDIVKNVSDIMSYPFSGILESNLKFPVSVSIGTSYRDWKFYKRF